MIVECEDAVLRRAEAVLEGPVDVLAGQKRAAVARVGAAEGGDAHSAEQRRGARKSGAWRVMRRLGRLGGEERRGGKYERDEQQPWHVIRWRCGYERRLEEIRSVAKVVVGA